MALPLVILHGYASSSSPFRPLREALEAQTFLVREVALADYVTRDDTITFDDLARLFQERLQDDRPGFLQDGFNLIAHSTGGLLARHWLATHYADASSRVPVQHMVLLAPANFGSRLAHHGNSVVGRFLSDIREGEWQTGRHILSGLELGSRFQWDLAHADLFNSSGPPRLARGQPYTYIIVGNEPYRGLRRLWAPSNEAGSDGVVRVAAASLRGRKVRVDFTNGPPSWASSPGAHVPLAVLKGVTHGSVYDPEVCLKLVLQCLAVSDASAYGRVGQQFDALSRRAFAPPSLGARLKRLLRLAPAEGYHAFQQFIFRVVDTEGVPVPDYRLEFSVTDRRTGRLDQKLTAWLDSHVVQHAHTFGDDRSLRTLYADLTDLRRLERRLKKHREITMSLAVEDLDRNISYLTGGMKQVPVAGAGAPNGGAPFFTPNATTLVELVVEQGATEPVRLRRFQLS